MYLSLCSPAAVRLLAAITAGEGINRSARLAGIHTEVCYRLLRDRYLELRRGGLAPAAAAAEMGLESSLVPRWEALVDQQRTRHHRRHPEAVEQRFWAEFESGQTASAAARAAVSVAVLASIVGAGRSPQDPVAPRPQCTTAWLIIDDSVKDPHADTLAGTEHVEKDQLR